MEPDAVSAPASDSLKRAIEHTEGKAARMLGIIGATIAIVELSLILVQLRQQTLMASAANAQTLIELTQPMNLEIVKDPTLADLNDRGTRDYASLSALEKSRYRRLLTMYLNIQENAYIQSQNGLMLEELYRPWFDDLKRNRSTLAAVWPELRSLFSSSFALAVDRILEGKRSR